MEGSRSGVEQDSLLLDQTIVPDESATAEVEPEILADDCRLPTAGCAALSGLGDHVGNSKFRRVGQRHVHTADAQTVGKPLRRAEKP